MLKRRDPHAPWLYPYTWYYTLLYVGGPVVVVCGMNYYAIFQYTALGMQYINAIITGTIVMIGVCVHVCARVLRRRRVQAELEPLIN